MADRPFPRGPLVVSRWAFFLPVCLRSAENTVNFHIKNLVDKLQANDRTHAVTIALRRGLLRI